MPVIWNCHFSLSYLICTELRKYSSQVGTRVEFEYFNSANTVLLDFIWTGFCFRVHKVSWSIPFSVQLFVHLFIHLKSLLYPYRIIVDLEQIPGMLCAWCEYTHEERSIHTEMSGGEGKPGRKLMIEGRTLALYQPSQLWFKCLWSLLCFHPNP